MVIPLHHWGLFAFNKMEWFAAGATLSCSPNEVGHVKERHRGERHKGMPSVGYTPATPGKASGDQVLPPRTGTCCTLT